MKNTMGWSTLPIGEATEDILSGQCLNGDPGILKPGQKAVLKVSAVTYGYFRDDEYKVLRDLGQITKGVYPQRGDLLFSRANTKEYVGATALIEEDYPDLMLPDKLWKLIFKPEINPVFAKHFLSNPETRAVLAEMATGTSGSMYNISMEKLRGLSIIVPDMELQEQFVSFAAQSDKSKFAWLKSQFIEMFGNGLHGNEKFPLSSMKEVCSVIQDGEHSTVKRVDEGHLFLSARNVKLDHNIVLEPVTYVDDERFAKIRKRFAPQAGDVLLTCAGTIGNAAVVPDMEPFVADRGVTMLRPQTGILNSQYLLAFFSSDFAAEQMRRGTKATALAHLYLKQINELRIILPPIDLQNQFADFVKQTDKSK